MNSSKLALLVMAGGKGTRFWPESTSRKPKQYLGLTGGNELIRETFLRFEGLIDPKNSFVVTTREQKKLAMETTNGILPGDNFILEPSGRNTSPCIFLSLAFLKAKGFSEEDVVVIVPSDHVILNHKGFQKTIQEGIELSKKLGHIVTIGVKPHFPHTGFGYIERGEQVGENSFRVKSFREKPKSELAQEYVKSGEYYWNAGMFLAPLGVLLEEYREHAPQVFSCWEKLKKSLADEEKLSHAYDELEATSIDYAIMEKSQKVSVISAQFDWNDLGSWDALSSVCEEIEGNTFVQKNAHHIAINSKGNTIFSKKELVVLVETNDMIIVENEKVLMVLPLSHSQKVKDVVEKLKDSSWGEKFL